MAEQLEVHQFICRSDNFAVLVHAPEAGLTAAIDAPDANAIEAALAEKGWRLTHILTTHHHGDHTAGNEALKAAHGCKIIGPRPEEARIPGIDEAVGDGDVFEFAGHDVRVYETPGHTAGHVSYFFEEARLAFVGDTLFSLGCGRLFEGTAETMWQSLSKLKGLPGDTKVYCGHEYTLSNAEFALTIEPENAALKARAEEVRALRAEGKPTLPTTVAQECATNPFLRPDSPEIRARLSMPDAPDWEVFGEIRRRKDNA